MSSKRRRLRRRHEDVYGAKPIINLLSVEGEEQVMLRVSVAEVQRDTLKQFGINLGALVNSGNFTTAILSDNALPSVGGGRPRHPARSRSHGRRSQCLQCWGRWHRISERRGCHSLRKLRRRHRVAIRQSSTSPAFCAPSSAMAWSSTLAEPNLTAVSGEPARFLAGGEFPIPSSTALVR